MANTKSAAKRARQTTRRTAQNKAAASRLKSLVKKTRKTIAAGDKPEAKKSVQELSSALDKSAKTGRIHRNTANRRKSKLNRQVSAMA
jgi:small subunit ribosomal protein S20